VHLTLPTLSSLSTRTARGAESWAASSGFDEHPALWDEDKARVLGTAPPAAFGFLGRYGSGNALPGDGWPVTARPLAR
jgi:hypothetical protein